MLIGEPARSQGDLNFSLWGFPVRISPWFWLVALLLGWRGTDMKPALVVTWIIAVLISILIHEFGHAFAFRHFGIHAHVVLYHFGGLAVPDGTFGSAFSAAGARDPRQQIMISAAGPAAQLVAAAVVILVIAMAGYKIPFYFGPLQALLPEPGGKLYTSEALAYFLQFFLAVSIYWALLNLMPVYPLDGGQIARELFLMFGSGDAIPQSLLLSVCTGAALAVFGLMYGHSYLGIMFGLLAYSSYTTLQAYRGRGGGFGGPRW